MATMIYEHVKDKAAFVYIPCDDFDNILWFMGVQVGKQRFYSYVEFLLVFQDFRA